MTGREVGVAMMPGTLTGIEQQEEVFEMVTSKESKKNVSEYNNTK